MYIHSNHKYIFHRSHGTEDYEFPTTRDTLRASTCVFIDLEDE